LNRPENKDRVLRQNNQYGEVNSLFTNDVAYFNQGSSGGTSTDRNHENEE
jgi:hypothetical protein